MPDATSLAASTLPKRTNLRFQQPRWKVPIVDRYCRLVGWTTITPEILGPSLRHEEAEQLVGEPILAVYVQIADAANAANAGAPPGWKEPWRCLALCAQSARPRQVPLGEVPTINLET